MQMTNDRSVQYLPKAPMNFEENETSFVGEDEHPQESNRLITQLSSGMNNPNESAIY